MNNSLRELFREVADTPPDERERILAQAPVSAHTRAELESLLRYDSAGGESFTRRVSEVAHDALQWSNGPASRQCGPYRLIRLLGAGGMGAVYLAERHDGEIQQEVAIKLLRADSDRPAWRDRFLKERQLLAYLNHPSIARLLDAGHTDDGRPYLVMEYVDGVAIDDYAAPLDLRARLALFLLVCDGVSHAHRQLVVHRDLKPSNILVDSSGHPKLLDFGIAKLLDADADQTRTVERLLTPNYASPEQLRGDVQTTATDIYSLGAVLHKLLTGRSPTELRSQAPPCPDGVAGDNTAATHSGPIPRLPSDVDYVLRKALRPEPEERYASVDAFADDIRAFLALRPVQARSGDIWYRARKFVCRYRVPVAAAAVALASVSLGSAMARHQRGIAQTRYVQVRQLVNKVLALDEVAEGSHGSSKAMHELLDISREHLEALVPAANGDQGLALEVADAYSRLGRAQGVCTASSEGQRARAEESLRKANNLLAPIVSASPDNRKALLTAARISHDRMIRAENDRHNDEAVAHGREAAGYLGRLVALGNLSPSESDTASEIFYNIALSSKNLHLTDDGIRYARLSIESSRLSPNAHLRMSLAQSMLADLLRLTGDLHGALLAIRDARRNLAKVQFPKETERWAAWCRVLGREAKILGVPGISLNRHEEAVPLLQKVFDLLEQWTQVDRRDAWSRLLFVSVGREFGDTLRLRDPRAALRVYDHALQRVREVSNNAEARRGEAELLAGSAYALRRLDRTAEAKERIDEALGLLAGTNDYPADRVVPHDAADEAVRALAEHFAETGETGRAAELYESLLGKVIASGVDPKNNLRHAVALSHIYGSLASLHRRSARRETAESYATARLDLWRQWDNKLPNNGFVRRQLEVSRTY